MALRRVDEFDGITDAKPYEFSIEGLVYEIDLSEESLNGLYAALKPYIEVGRRKGGKTPAKSVAAVTPRGKKTKMDPSQRKAIESWARSQGRPVSSRGRLPANIIDDFERSHPSSPTSPAFAAASGE